MKSSKEIKHKMEVIKQMLEENGLLTDADSVNLQILEDEFIVYEMCNKDIEENGITMKDRTGVLKINPSATMRNRSANTILQILKEFGISSKSRKLLLMKNLDVEHEESGLDQYMKMIQ